ncbi:hypothetical protein RVV79_003834 [Burkholderia contaminans]|nr:hypothetical protein [Burkholderia contaminans]
MQKFDFTAPVSGTPQVLNVPGRYLKYVAGNAGGNDAGLIVTPGGKPGSKILLYPGQAVTLPNDGTPGPNAWTVTNAVGAAQITGTIVVGNGRIDDNTLQGTVQVVDGGKARSLAGAAFSIAVASATPGAGAYARVQLWNPAASPNRLVVESIGLSAAATAYTANVSLENVQVGAQNYHGVNKNAGSATVAAAVGGSDATQTVLDTFPAAYQLAVQANAVNVTVPKEPYVIPPGYGLLLWANTAAVACTALFEWFEEPNV